MNFKRLLCAEVKSAFLKLPLIILSGVVLLAVVILFTFIITSYSHKTDGGKSIIAVSAPNDTFTIMAITAVENMDSVSDICKFIRVNENEAEAMVMDNRASAALIFGDNFVEDIIKGKNTRPRIIVSQNSNKLFMELAECGSSMLAVVQAGIYSAERSYAEATGEKLSHQLNIELNMEYVNTVFSREKTFKISSMDIMDIKDYYACMLLPVFLLLFAVSLGGVIYPQSNSFYEYTGLGFIKISAIQFIKSFIIYIVLFVILWSVGLACNINMRFNLFAVITLSFITTTVYAICNKKTNGSLFILIFTFVTGFISGAFIPPAILPDKVRAISEFMPVYNMGFQLMGDCDIIYSAILWIVCCIIIFIGGKKKCLL